MHVAVEWRGGRVVLHHPGGNVPLFQIFQKITAMAVTVGMELPQLGGVPRGQGEEIRHLKSVRVSGILPENVLEPVHCSLKTSE